MSTEIEFKFSLSGEKESVLFDFLANYHTISDNQQQLTTCYYDTAAHYLYQHGISLRVRTVDQQYEMTVKSAGRSVAGLSQRNEINIPIATNQPILTLLPETLFPPDCSIEQLQQQIHIIFSTNFQRKCWLIAYQQSEIEVVLDQGQIIADSQNIPINEIELELKAGNITDLFNFANELAILSGLRLADQSKAQRGYLLVTKQTINNPDSFSLLTVPAKATIEEGLITAIEYSLHYWQRSEAIAMQDQQVCHLANCMVLLRQVFTVFDSVVPRQATAVIRDKLLQLEAQLPTITIVADIIDQPNYLQTKLAVIHWLFSKQWYLYQGEQHKQKMTGSFKRFADIMLGRLGKILKTEFAGELPLQTYQDKQQKLQKIVYQFYLLSGAYANAAVYIRCWQQLSCQIEQQHSSLKQLQQTTRTALSMPVFWLNGATSYGARE